MIRETTSKKFMKQRNIFAVFILSIVTLGIYFLIWIYTIHRDLSKKIEDKKSLPSFLWLLVPEILIVLAFIVIVVSVLAAVMSGPEQGEVILSAIAIPFIIIAAIAPIVIGFWWFYLFCQVFYKAVGGTEATVSYVIWIISFCICLPIWTLIVQNDINKSLESKHSEAS